MKCSPYFLCLNLLLFIHFVYKPKLHSTFPVLATPGRDASIKPRPHHTPKLGHVQFIEQ